jgi:hypothetical protein
MKRRARAALGRSSRPHRDAPQRVSESSWMRATVVFVFSIVALYACIDSPTVELVDRADGAASSTSSTPAAPGPCDPARCAAAGGTCTDDVCSFTCTGSVRCEASIRCPSGMPCGVSCVGKDACTRRVECREATRCTIVCDGESACKEGVTCEGPDCAISCKNGGCEDEELRCCATACTVNGAAATCP